MAKIWVIADTHFGHSNIVHKFKRADGSPLRDFKNVHEHDETIIRNWNERVRPEDHVYHLGDFAMARIHLATAQRLNGHKRLVRGNHDIFKTREYVEAGFEEIYGVRVFRPQDQQGKSGFILSHVEKHRTYGTGPRYLKLGGRVVYKVDDLKAWSKLGYRNSTSDPGIGTVLPAKRHAQGTTIPKKAYKQTLRRSLRQGQSDREENKLS